MREATEVIKHYGHRDLRDKLAAALTAAGLSDKRLSPAELAPLDQFHTRGMAATVELAEAAGIAPGTSVLDIGSGLGGPSRYLATKFDCRGQGRELSPPLLEAAPFPAPPARAAGQGTPHCPH